MKRRIFTPQRNRYFSVAWIGLAVTVAGTAASYSQQADAADAQASAAQGINFGKKPKVAEYQPVSIDTEQMNGILGNLSNMPEADKLMQAANLSIDADAMRRARKFIPNYQENMRLEGDATNDLLSGRLPYDDVLDIVADRQGLSNTLGTPGGAGSATLRDLGLSRLDAIKSGAGMMQGMVSIAEQINPVNRRVSTKDFLIDPMDRIRTIMDQNQLIQQSTQNKYNIRAGLSPSEQAGSQIALANAMRPNTSAADTTAAISGIVNQFGSVYRGSQASQAATLMPTAAVPNVVGGGYRYTPAGGFAPIQPMTTSIPA